MESNRHQLWDVLDSTSLRQLWPVLTFLALGGLILWNLSMLVFQIPVISFTSFHHHLQAGHIAQIEVQGETITGQFKPEFQNRQESSSRLASDFKTHVPSFAGQSLMQEILQQQVLVTVHPKSNHALVYLMLAFLPAALLVCFIVLRFSAARG